LTLNFIHIRAIKKKTHRVMVYNLTHGVS